MAPLDIIPYINLKQGLVIKLYFVRHGQTNDNAGIIASDNTVRNKGLNEAGIAQAENAAKSLMGVKFDTIVSSPLKRTMQTAEIINQHHNLPIVEISDLRELEASTYLDADSWCGSFDFSNLGKIDGVEPIDKFFARVYSALDDIRETCEDQTVMVVSHGGVKHALEAYVKKLPLEDSMLSERMENCEVLEYDL